MSRLSLSIDRHRWRYICLMCKHLFIIYWYKTTEVYLQLTAVIVNALTSLKDAAAAAAHLCCWCWCSQRAAGQVTRWEIDTPVLLVLVQPTCCWTGNMMRDLKVNSQTPASSPHESTTLDLMHPSTSSIVLCRYDIYDNIKCVLLALALLTSA